jgi:glycosyltransferase involved in cell wall biosynthesis
MDQLKVLVLDMQPISPAVGGGRQRLLGLYHDLGPSVDTVYVGTYDWPGESRRDQMLTPTLREICVPLSEAHHSAARETAARMDGRGMIDIEFPEQVRLSPEYLSVARREMADASVVIFSHPWCYPPLAADIRPDQLVVYDAHNVESILRVSLHDDLPQGAELMDLVVATEAALLERSGLVYCCSAEEVTLFHSIFEVPLGKLRIAPNGTFTDRFSTGLLELRSEAREASSEKRRPVVVFMGSQYGPNAEAGQFIVEKLAPHAPDVTFLLVGGVGDGLAASPFPKNIVCTGIVDDDAKWRHLLSADIAINPMFSGAGTNVKMFDFLAAGLPVLTTAVGARGISEQSTDKGEMVISDRHQFLADLLRMIREPISPTRRLACYQYVQRRFSWEAISRSLGDELRLHATSWRKPHVPVLMVSTWGVACGIAEHGQYLADGLRDAGADLVIFGNELDGHELLGVGPELKFPVVRGWRWDNKNWRESGANLAVYEATLESL